MNEFVDPRENVTDPVEVGQVYTDSRTDEEIKVLYEDDYVVLATSVEPKEGTWSGHRYESKKQFTKAVGAGRFKLTDATESASSRCAELAQSMLERYESADGRTASHKADALRELIEEIESDEPIDETLDFSTVNGIGAKTAARLRNAGFSTKDDVRRATDHELSEVKGMGAKSLQNLREYVK